MLIPTKSENSYDLSNNFLNFIYEKNSNYVEKNSKNLLPIDTGVQPEINVIIDTNNVLTVLLYFYKKLYYNFILKLVSIYFCKNVNAYAHNHVFNISFNRFNLYESSTNFGIKNVLYKYNNSSSFLTSIGFYFDVFKFFPIFRGQKDRVSIDKNIIYNFSPIFQEIIELKPDKAKKIFYKKKLVKTFTFLNEIKKKVSYSHDLDIDRDFLKKIFFFKNIFTQLLFNINEEKVVLFSSKLTSNKSMGFWKKNNFLSNSFKNTCELEFREFFVFRYKIKFIYCVVESVKEIFEDNYFTEDTERSPYFHNSLVTPKEEVFKKMFFFNFIKLFSKTIDINFSTSYSYLNHSTEFKDYFFKKNNPPVRDLLVSKFNNLNKFNNFFPLYCLSFKKFKKLILFSKKQQSPIYSSYYMFYLINFLEMMCKKKIWLRLNTKKQISDQVYSKFVALFTKNKADQINIGKHFFLVEFYEIIYLSFINRDISFFAMWFKKIMEKIHLKKHKKVVKVLHNTIRNNKLFLELTGVKGFSMDVRGKLGTAGNSKKKHYAFTVGSIAPTTKSHGLNLSQTTVRTSTGVLGVTILMSY